MQTEKSVIEILERTWFEFQDELAEGLYDECNLEQLKHIAFYTPFKNIMDSAARYISFDLKVLRSIYRGVGESDITECTKDRFFPTKKYAALNRMNDENKLYLYLAASFKDMDKNRCIQTIKKECRFEEFGDAHICKFGINLSAERKKIINLTLDYRYKGMDLEQMLFVNRTKIVNESKKNDKTTLHTILIKYYIELLTNKTPYIFSPVDKSIGETKLRRIYRPFHVLANYFEEAGYAGMLYPSTVSSEGKNLVLFNLGDVEPKLDTLEMI